MFAFFVDSRNRRVRHIDPVTSIASRDGLSEIAYQSTFAGFCE
jgi:hypothetical protein